jgi:hypothetical protein
MKFSNVVQFHAQLLTQKLLLNTLMVFIMIHLVDLRKITKSVLLAGVKKTVLNIGAFVILGVAIGVMMVSLKSSVV